MRKRAEQKLPAGFDRAMRELGKRADYSEERLAPLRWKVASWLQAAAEKFGPALPACQATTEHGSVKLFWEQNDRAVVVNVHPLYVTAQLPEPDGLSVGGGVGTVYHTEADVVTAEGRTRGPNIPGLGEWWSCIVLPGDEEAYPEREQVVTDGSELLAKLEWLLEERPRRRSRRSRNAASALVG
jgi:hypothetical protein